MQLSALTINTNPRNSAQQNLVSDRDNRLLQKIILALEGQRLWKWVCSCLSETNLYLRKHFIAHRNLEWQRSRQRKPSKSWNINSDWKKRPYEGAITEILYRQLVLCWQLLVVHFRKVYHSVPVHKIWKTMTKHNIHQENITAIKKKTAIQVI